MKELVNCFVLSVCHAQHFFVNSFLWRKNSVNFSEPSRIHKPAFRENTEHRLSCCFAKMLCFCSRSQSSEVYSVLPFQSAVPSLIASFVLAAYLAINVLLRGYVSIIAQFGSGQLLHTAKLCASVKKGRFIFLLAWWNLSRMPLRECGRWVP